MDDRKLVAADLFYILMLKNSNVSLSPLALRRRASISTAVFLIEKYPADFDEGAACGHFYFHFLEMI